MVLGLLAASWVAYRAVQARQHLEVAKAELPALQAAWAAGDTQKAARSLTAVQQAAGAAFSATHDPVWWVAGNIPFAGQPLATTRGLTEAVNDLASTSLPDLAAAADIARPERLVVGPATVDVARLSKASGSLGAAASSLAQQRAKVQALSPSYVPAIATARRELLDKLSAVAGTAETAATTARVLPAMLGAQGTRRYFVGFQNPAELRGSGGLLDAFAIVSATKGAVTVERTGTNGQLPQVPDDVPGVDPAFLDRYSGQGALQLWVNSNLSPDFPETARVWAAMWEAATGDAIDGAIALDPYALADVLAATGPVQVAGVGKVGADNLVNLVLKDQYTLETDASQAQRKSAMLGVGTATIAALLQGKGDRGQLLDAMRKAAADGHVLVHSGASDDEQKAITVAGISGSVAGVNGPFAQAVIVNAAGSKLDTYLKTSTAYVVTDCSAAGRTARITVTLTNTAPAKGLPEYVTRRADGPRPAVPVGQNRVGVSVLVTPGATLESATLDGAAVDRAPAPGEAPQTLEIGGSGQFLLESTDAGHPAFGAELELPLGKTRTFVVTVKEPPSNAKPTMPTQSLILPVGISADVTKCGAGS